MFQLQLKELHEDILHRHVLGHTIAHVYVIEIQKRGLPHAHMILFLSDADKPRTPEQVLFMTIIIVLFIIIIIIDIIISITINNIILIYYYCYYYYYHYH